VDYGHSTVVSVLDYSVGTLEVVGRFKDGNDSASAVEDNENPDIRSIGKLRVCPIRVEKRNDATVGAGSIVEE
jgi:hypothetical protein